MMQMIMNNEFIVFTGAELLRLTRQNQYEEEGGKKNS